MRRHVLDSEITRLEQTLEATGERFGFRSKEYVRDLDKLRDLRIERMKRETGFRRFKRHRRAA